MSSGILLTFIVLYFLVLIIVAWATSRRSNNDSFFIGNRKSNWFLVAFGMVGTSMTGVTFLSVPGTVGNQGFGYFQVVIGYFLGYFAVAYILLPLYYSLKLTSIYDYLNHRLGWVSYKTGALFFILSRTVGATARLYLVINILQIFVLNQLGVSFWMTSVFVLLMIMIYTFEGGVKTIVYTDMLQTFFMLTALLVCVIYILHEYNFSVFGAIDQLQIKGYTHLWNTDVNSKGFWLKQILGGAFITIAMTGLDQEMMQKNISVEKLKNSRKNIFTFSTIMVVVNIIFLFLGGLLYLAAESHQLNVPGDDLFAEIALNYLPSWVAIIFTLGIISTLFPSADGAITALTSSFCLDILGVKRRENFSEKKIKRIRLMVHFAFLLLFFLCLMIFKWVDNKSIINFLLRLAGYTYGPLLGLFAFGIFPKRVINPGYGPMIVCILAPIVCLFLSDYEQVLFGGYSIGLELLLINGLITFSGLWIVSKKRI